MADDNGNESLIIDAETSQRLREAHEGRIAAGQEHFVAAEIAKARKRDYDAAQACEQRILNEIFGPVPTGPLLEVEPEEWRSVRLDTLGLRPGTLKALAENDPPIVTLGELSDWQADKAEFWAKDIKGIGQTAQDEIADATAAFWNARREQADESADEPTEALAAATT